MGKWRQHGLFGCGPKRELCCVCVCLLAGWGGTVFGSCDQETSWHTFLLGKAVQHEKEAPHMHHNLARNRSHSMRCSHHQFKSPENLVSTCGWLFID